MDRENPEFPDQSFDAVLCRFGLIYMPHQQRALSEWRRVLKPGGRVAVAVFSTPERNGWGSVPISVIRKRAQLPVPLPSQPGPFSLGDDGVLAAVFAERVSNRSRCMSSWPCCRCNRPRSTSVSRMNPSEPLIK
ncbi:MAG: class I SAM-dependent methyltransferase [Candidatus Binatia bacterium]